MAPVDCISPAPVAGGSVVPKLREGSKPGPNEHVGFQVDDIINRPEKIIVHLLFAEVHAGFRIEAAEGGETQVGIGDVNEFHWIFLNGILRDILAIGRGCTMIRLREQAGKAAKRTWMCFRNDYPQYSVE
jgi:hypothetical protein